GRQVEPAGRARAIHYHVIWLIFRLDRAESLAGHALGLVAGNQGHVATDVAGDRHRALADGPTSNHRDTLISAQANQPEAVHSDSQRFDQGGVTHVN
ncbi:unnamed protein product, partial [marine sediment metagenome]